MDNIQNQYKLALFTTFLAGFFSISGSYLITKYTIQHEQQSKEKEYKIQAYEHFLKNISRKESPTISKILHLGTLSEQVSTDYDIQVLEDSIADLVKTERIQETYWKLNSSFSTLQFYGDKRTKEICSDILSLLSLQHSQIKWKKYRKSTQIFYKNLYNLETENSSIGSEETISSDERIAILMISRVYQELLFHLQETLHKQ